MLCVRPAPSWEVPSTKIAKTRIRLRPKRSAMKPEGSESVAAQAMKTANSSRVVVRVLAAPLLDPVYDGLQHHVFAGIDNDPSVTLVAIDQRSSDRLAAGSWPWSNAIHARVIDHLAKLHPMAILVDIVLNRSGE